MKKRENPVVALVKAWEVFEDSHPTGTVAEFCQDYLMRHQTGNTEERISHQDVADIPGMRVSDALVVTMARVVKHSNFYSRKVMQKLPVDNGEDFAYLATLHFHGPMRKSELIHRNISEFTSGTNVINRLLKQHLIDEYNDPDDARSKQVKITPKGVERLMHSLPDMAKVSDLLLDGVLTEEEKKLAVHILLKVDRFHSEHHPAIRNLSIEEIQERLSERAKE
ncbi:hypothetical protein GCM10023187_30260 [Nibrella viscosa]|uniref:HTH marR-type domain-containing protein n=1 Tax=Nibrella viscosa TaxID=1084524 RepID=A0ABP8KJ66_9BACT